jgi:hypothetical protein
MTPKQRVAIWTFIPETALYGCLAIVFCFGVTQFLGRPLRVMFKAHPAEYGFLALALMGFQGYLLERITHLLCELFRRRRKARA